MRRRRWTRAGAGLAVLVSIAALFLPGFITGVPAAAAAGPWVDPGLTAKVANGHTVRVNVVTATRADLPAAAGSVAAGRVLQTLARLPIVTLRVDRAGLERLAAQSGVVSVTEDKPSPPVLADSIPLIGADRTRAAGLTGKGTAVAVLDTGVATHHPFFGGRVVAEACFSPADPDYEATSLCPNGTPQQEGPGSADSDTGPCASLDCAHGTHVAGIAAGNAQGVAGAPGSGVAPAANIVAVQIFSRFESEDFCGVGEAPCVLSFTSAQLAGMEKVLSLRESGTPLVAANLSLGSGLFTAPCDSDPRKAAIDKLLAAGVATVVASGNRGYPDAVSAPACVSSAVAVGSTTKQDEISDFSNRGPLLDLFAPGSDIVSSIPGNQWAPMSGTSMATPHVTGAFAVLRQKFPQAPIAELLAKLQDTGKPIEGTPRIQLDDAALGVIPRPGPGQYFDQRARILDNVQVSANSTMSVPVAGVAGLPATGLASVALNISARGAWFNNGAIAVYPSGDTAPDGNAVSYDSTHVSSTLVFAKVGSDGKILVANRSTQPVTLYLDVHGYTLDHAVATIGGTYVASPPTRLANRISVPAWGNYELATSGLPATGVDEVALGVRLKSTAGGTVRMYPSGDVYPVEANAEYVANTPTQFFTIVKPGAGKKINIHNLGGSPVEVTVDLTGYYTAAQRGWVVNAVRAAPVARDVTIPGGGSYTYRPQQGPSALGLTVTARGTTGTGAVELVGSAVTVVEYRADGLDRVGFVLAPVRPDGTVVLKNNGTGPVTVGLDLYATLSTR
ncbi:S8 family peptidase [Nonomuraea sp. NPDC050556]|uniref:S8 family peptidase n=1 Tax=Nonomuraea sp. NPDC050556 TaxID=3364369 RepID=UPI0037B27DE3